MQGTYPRSMPRHSAMPQHPLKKRYASVDEVDNYEHKRGEVYDEGAPANWSARIKLLRSDYVALLKKKMHDSAAVSELTMKYGFVFAVKHLKVVSPKARQLFKQYPNRFK